MPTRENNSRYRRFCFTWNNYPDNAHEVLAEFFNSKNAIYMIVGKEIGESGTPHLQGYVHLKDQMTFTALKRCLPTLHLERAKGTGLQNKTYCSKEADFYEMGTFPQDAGEASKNAWKTILDAAESGNWDYLKANYPRIWVTMSEKLISKRIPRTSVIDGDTQNEWWYGKTGTGKSRLAWEKYGNICYQKMLNKWWDGYDAQPIVIIEEWSPKNDVTASALKIWADRYPFTAQIKGGVLQKIRPFKIIVISNYRLYDCFPDTRDAEPIARRFTQLEFPSQADQAAANADAFVLNHQIVGEPSDSEQLPADVTETTEDSLIADGPDEDEIILPFEAHNWLTYATQDDLNRLLAL